MPFHHAHYHPSRAIPNQRCPRGSGGCGQALARGGNQRILGLTGPTWHSGPQIAAIASAAVGRPLGFDAVPNATAAAILQQGGVTP